MLVISYVFVHSHFTGEKKERKLLELEVVPAFLFVKKKKKKLCFTKWKGKISLNEMERTIAQDIVFPDEIEVSFEVSW